MLVGLAVLAPALYRWRMVGQLRALESQFKRDFPGAVHLSTGCQRFGLPDLSLEPDFWEDFRAWFSRMRGQPSRLDFYVREGNPPAHAYHIMWIHLRSNGKDLHRSYLWSPRIWSWVFDSAWEHPTGPGSDGG